VCRGTNVEGYRESDGPTDNEAEVSRHATAAVTVSAGVLLSLAVAGCGSKPSAAPTPIASLSAVLASVTHLGTTVHAHDVLVSWTAATGPVDGYAVYLDSRKPVFVSSTTGHELFGDVPGGSHFVQVVTKDGTGVSNPVGAKVHVRQPKPINRPQTTAEAQAPAATVVVTAPSGDAAEVPPTSAPAASVTAHTLDGSISVVAFNDVIQGIVTGEPGYDPDMLGTAQFRRMGRILDSLQSGSTYSCPLGAGDGFSDLVPGGQVVVADGSGDVLGTASLNGGTLSVLGCTFTFTVPDLPPEPFYEVTVTHRGTLTYSAQELATKGWKIASSVSE
jgi:hypothetical protein